MNLATTSTLLILAKTVINMETGPVRYQAQLDVLQKMTLLNFICSIYFDVVFCLGMMGNAQYADNAPIMCFNAAKMFQLGWYSQYHLTLNAGSTWSGQIYGVADGASNKVPSGGIMFIRYTGGSQDYFIGWNHKTGVNSGVVEAGDLVEVIMRSPGTGYAQSWLVGKLTAGQVYQDNTITVQVTQINSAGPYASVHVHAPTKAPTRFPSQAPSSAPSRTPTRRPTPLFTPVL